VEEDVISALVAEVGAPVNVLYRPGAPSLARLAELGVARITFGPGIHRVAEAATAAALARIAAGLEP
jgi:2-methylisocitrate lyase-like PEP mutase family enzyme